MRAAGVALLGWAAEAGDALGGQWNHEAFRSRPKELAFVAIAIGKGANGVVVAHVNLHGHLLSRSVELLGAPV